MKKWFRDIMIEVKNPTESMFTVILGIYGWTMLLIILLGGM